MVKRRIAFFLRWFLIFVVLLEVGVFTYFKSHDPLGWGVFSAMPWRYLEGVLFRESHNDAAQLAEIKAFLKGKSVAIVGPASSFQDQWFGSEIDAHDVVARVNSGAFTSAEFRRDYGSRVDVLFCGLNDLNIEVLSKTTELWSRAKFMIAVGTVDSMLPLFLETFRSFHLPPIYFTSRAWIKKIEATHVRRPNTGLSSIRFLLETDIESLDVYGFDFYGSGYNRDLEAVLQTSNFNRLRAGEQSSTTLSDAIQFWASWHNQREQEQFVQEYLSKDPRVTWRSPRKAGT